MEGDDGSNIRFDVRDEDLDPNQSMLKQQRKRFLNMAIDRLPEKYRMLVELRYFKELSYEEVAQELQIPLGTVKAQLFRARELLNQELKKYSFSNVGSGRLHPDKSPEILTFIILLLADLVQF